jgi:hypothetical protein
MTSKPRTKPGVWVRTSRRTHADGTVVEHKYWSASWRQGGGGKVKNAYLGKCDAVTEEQALAMALRLKAAEVGALSEREVIQPTNDAIEAAVKKHIDAAVKKYLDAKFAAEVNPEAKVDFVTAGPTSGSEAYPGVTKNRHGKWEARAKVDGKRTHLSSYPDRRDAIKAIEASTKPEPVQAVGKMPDAAATGGG